MCQITVRAQIIDECSGWMSKLDALFRDRSRPSSPSLTKAVGRLLGTNVPYNLDKLTLVRAILWHDNSVWLTR